jgi:hypothetical protein
MQIVCTTPQAAAQVLTILAAARLQPVRDFQIRPVLSIEPPITYTMLVALTAAQMRKIRKVAAVDIVG